MKNEQIRIRIYENIDNFEFSVTKVINKLIREYNKNRNLRRKIKTLIVKDDEVYKNDSSK